MKTIDIVCPHCKARSNWKVPLIPVIFGCSSCDRIFQMDQSGSLTKEPPLSGKFGTLAPAWFVPGARLQIKNTKYTVISLYINGVNWQEWDSEDSAWESGYDEYLEWFLVGTDGSELWMEQGDHANYLNINEPVPVTQELIDLVQTTQDVRSRVQEKGHYRTIAFRGIDDEPLDRRSWNYKLLNSSVNPVTIEWCKDTPTDQWRAFKTVGLFRKLDLERGRIRNVEEVEELREQTRHLGFYRTAFGVTALAMLLMMLWSLIGAGDKRVFNEAWIFSTFQPGAVNNSVAEKFGVKDTILANPEVAAAVNRQNNTEKYTREMGTVQLQSGIAYRFETTCSFEQANADADFNILILKMPEGTPVNTVSASFFSESGYDSEGAWSEATLSDYFQFTVEEAGEYLIEAQNLTTNAGISGTLIVNIIPVVLSRYFIIFFLIIVLSWLVLQWRWEYMAIQSNLDTSGWLLKIMGK